MPLSGAWAAGAGVRRKKERQLLVRRLLEGYTQIGVQQRVVDDERIVRVGRCLGMLASADHDQAAHPQLRRILVRLLDRRKTHARFLRKGVVHDRFHRVEPRRELGLPVEYDLPVFRLVQLLDRPGHLVALADLVDHLLVGVAEPHEHREVGRVGLLVLRRHEGDRRGRQLHDDRQHLRVILLREAKERRAHREGVWHGRAVECGHRRRLVVRTGTPGVSRTAK